MIEAPPSSNRAPARRLGPLAAIATIVALYLLSGPLAVVFRLLPLDAVPVPIWIVVFALAVAGKWLAHRRGRSGISEAFGLVALLAMIVPVIALFEIIQDRTWLQLLAGSGALAAAAALLRYPRSPKTAPGASPAQ